MKRIQQCGWSLFILLFTVQAHSASLPNYILKKALGFIEGAVQDSATGLITRPGESVASAASVEMDEAISLALVYYADEMQDLQRTKQINHLQGKEHSGGGHALLDRRFSFYDYQIWDYDPDYGILFNGNVEQFSGTGIGVAQDTSDNWIEGVTKHWDAKYVVHSSYENSGGEGLRRNGGDFPLEVVYRLADLTYDDTKSIGSGITSAERQSNKRKYFLVSRIQKDKVTNVDLLESNTEITSGPNAHGQCKRIWKLKWPEMGLSELPPFGSLQALLDKLINEHEWEMHQFPIDYGW